MLEWAIDPNRGLGYETHFHIACLYAQAGEKDKAFEHLERSFQQRVWAMPQLQVCPQLDPIRDDPHFKELVDRIGKKIKPRPVPENQLKKQMPPSITAMSRCIRPLKGVARVTSPHVIKGSTVNTQPLGRGIAIEPKRLRKYSLCRPGTCPFGF